MHLVVSFAIFGSIASRFLFSKVLFMTVLLMHLRVATFQNTVFSDHNFNSEKLVNRINFRRLCIAICNWNLPLEYSHKRLSRCCYSAIKGLEIKHHRISKLALPIQNANRGIFKRFLLDITQHERQFVELF